MCRGVWRDETKVFWKGLALECVRATHGDDSMPIKTILTAVLGRAMEDALSVGSLNATTARVRMLFTLAHRWKNTGDGVTDTTDTSALCGDRGSSRAEKRAMASCKRFFAATL